MHVYSQEPEPEQFAEPLGWEGAVGDEHLADVEPEHAQEVEEALLDLARLRSEGVLGGFAELRKWVNSLGRLGGFSREACLRLTATMTECLTAQRPPRSEPTAEQLQQGFVRMGGLKQAVNALMLRLDDASAVAACTGLVAAAVAGSPHTAENVLDAMSDLKLLMRGIERHASRNREVAMAGCALISNLCSFAPYETKELIPARAKAHRDSQGKIANEGMLDIVTGILSDSVYEVKRLADKCRGGAEATLQQAALQRQTAGVAVVHRKQEDNLKSEMQRQKESIKRAMGNEEARGDWKRLFDLEASAAKIQSGALQALLLVATGNLNTTRMLISSLATAQAAAAAAEPAAEPPPRAARRKSVTAAPPPPPPAEPQELGEMSDILQAMGQVFSLLVDVLQGWVAKDRPAIAAQACRLMSMLAKHFSGAMKHVREDTRRHQRTMESKLKLDVSKLLAGGGTLAVSFAPLRPALLSLTAQLRAHPDHMPLCAAALDVLAELRCVAVLSAEAAGERLGPAGPEASKQTLWQWRVMVGKCAEKGEFTAAGKVLREAVHATEVANERMKMFGLRPEQLEGEGVFLTPRMLACAEAARTASMELAADLTHVAWKDGEPGRKERRADLKARELEATHGGEAERAVSPAGSAMSTHRSLTSAGGRSAATASSRRTTGRSKGKGKGKAMEAVEEEAPEPLGGRWDRALGFEEHDAADFDRVWRPTMEAALSRTLSTPAMLFTKTSSLGQAPARRRSGARDSVVSALGEVTLGLGAEEGAASDALDRLLDLQFVESAPGRLKARVVVQPADVAHQKAYRSKMLELQDPQAASALLTQTFAKSLRRDGFLAPRYGVRVQVKQGAPKPEDLLLARQYQASR